MSSLKLFQPIQVGDITLGHRVVLAPLTRFRANDAHVHAGDLPREYYEQRASTPGTLLISEATFIAPQAGGYPNVPGIWNDDQIAGWKKITDAVHAKGSYIYLQLWALGRAGVPDVLTKEGPYPHVSASDVPFKGNANVPRPLTIPEIKEYVQLYATAASNAVHKAGFDGVEVHGANGYLIDQFFQDVTNHRTDEYGGSVENRARFGLEVLEAVVKAVGAKKTGIRLSPWNRFQGMRMADPKPTFKYITTRISELFPDLAFLHVVSPRVDGLDVLDVLAEGENNDFIEEIWKPRVYISAGGYSRESALKEAEEKGNLIAFGRKFLANPDLPLRLKKDLPLNEGDRATYYVYGSTDPKGYTDYPFAE
ncbi:hypothetical protein PLICRDRAFT_114056 [Plicaturopsis crispa FD-325 SS-3]|nr:hypothetical protein PLICRDRAFT_114056 [Plicaturopsis crispa FD-325 SS-3]